MSSWDYESCIHYIPRSANISIKLKMLQLKQMCINGSVLGLLRYTILFTAKTQYLMANPNRGELSQYCRANCKTSNFLLFTSISIHAIMSKTSRNGTYCISIKIESKSSCCIKIISKLFPLCIPNLILAYHKITELCHLQTNTRQLIEATFVL